MCRLLAVRDADPFDISGHLESFASIARASREYQGDGWGCAWRVGESWHRFRTTRPIWECDLGGFGRTSLLLAHVRSAFRNEGLIEENNMPFLDGTRAFVFNGELHRVKIDELGSTGARKIFNYICRFRGMGTSGAFERATGIIRKRTGYVKAMNIILSADRTLHLLTSYREQNEYFTMHVKKDGSRLMICSEPYPDADRWSAVPNDTLEVFPS